MQVYKIPYNYKHEEKIFGGYVSLRQAIYLIFAIIMIGIFFIPLIPIVIKGLIFLILATSFVLFAFLKIDDTNADKYFIYIVKYIKRPKRYILEKGKEK